jgi:hypothetical protein
MGDSDIDQLYKTFQYVFFYVNKYSLYFAYFRFRLFGTPTNRDWSEMESLPYYRNNFPSWQALKLQNFIDRLPEEAIDMLLVSPFSFIFN